MPDVQAQPNAPKIPDAQIIQAFSSVAGRAPTAAEVNNFRDKAFLLNEPNAETHAYNRVAGLVKRAVDYGLSTGPQQGEYVPFQQYANITPGSTTASAPTTYSTGSFTGGQTNTGSSTGSSYVPYTGPGSPGAMQFSTGSYSTPSYNVSQGAQPTYATNYQPTVTNGNVSAYVPGGIPYSPTPGMNYVPTDTPGGIIPAKASQGENASIPLNYAAMPGIDIKGENGFPSFSFNFAAEQADAYERLRPFYEKLLSFAGGRLDLAKRIIEYTYQQGMRESVEEFDQAKREQDIIFPQENEQQSTEQNKRGIMTSGFGQTDRSRLGASQGLRRESIERAFANRGSRLGSQYGFGLEEKQRGFEEEKFGQERERRDESTQLAERKFGVKQVQYQGELDKASREEARRIRAEDRDFQIKLAKGEFA